jgi:hypothetical protein
MTKIPTLLLSFLLFITLPAYAQSYKWVKGGGSPGVLPPEEEEVQNMCTDENGNVYITSYIGTTNITADTFYRFATHYTGAYYHNFIASYTCDGALRWAKILEGYDGSPKIGNIVYHNGSVYVSGKIFSDWFHLNKYIGEDTIVANQNYSAYTARFDTGNNGKLKWITFVGSDVYGNQFKTYKPGVIAIDGQSRVHNFAPILPGCTVTPTFTTTTPGTYDLTYDTLGNLLSVSQVAAFDSMLAPTSVLYNKTTGRWFASIADGYSWWAAIPSPTYGVSGLAIFRPDNSLVSMDTSASGVWMGGLAYDGNNELYTSINADIAPVGEPPTTLAGVTMSFTVHSRNALLMKLDTNGNGRIIYNLHSAGTNYPMSFWNIALVGKDKVALGGYILGRITHGSGADTMASFTGEYTNPLFIILDTGGNHLYWDQFHDAGFLDLVTALTTDKIGNIYLGGRNQVTISAGSLTPIATHGGQEDYFVMKYGYDCACLSAPPPAANYTHTVTTTGAYTVAFTYTGSTGYDSVRWHFGDGGTSTITTPSHTYAGPGTYTACATVYTSCGSNTYCNTIDFSLGVQQPSAGNIRIYPNPTRDELIVSGLATSAAYRLMSITGAAIKQGIIQNNNGISLSDCTPGIYIVELLQNDGTKNVVKVVKE